MIEDRDFKQREIIINLLQSILTVQLYSNGANQAMIAKKLGVATATVNEVLRGLKRKD